MREPAAQTAGRSIVADTAHAPQNIYEICAYDGTPVARHVRIQSPGQKNGSCGSSRMARAASPTGLSPSCRCMVRSNSPISSPDAWWSSPKVRRPPTRSGCAISPRSAPSRALLAAPQTMCSLHSTVSPSRCGQMLTRRATSTPRSCFMASCAPVRGRPRASSRSILRPLGSQRRALTPTTGAPRTRSMTSADPQGGDFSRITYSDFDTRENTPYGTVRHSLSYKYPFFQIVLIIIHFLFFYPQKGETIQKTVPDCATIH